MLDFGYEEAVGPAEIEVPKPQAKVLERDHEYGKFVIEPLPRGFGITLGNPLRRILLGSIPGTAITWVKIEMVQHEYSSIPHIKEDVTEILLNVKAVRLRSFTERPGKLRLEVTGEGNVCAGDIISSADFEIVNPELHLATMDSPEARLFMEFNVEPGKGYVPASQGDGLPIGVLPVDAIFTPVRKVNYSVERIRVGQVTDYERLLLEVWTDGSIVPDEAVRKAANMLVEHFLLFSSLGVAGEGEAERPSLALTIPVEHYNTPVEKLELSARTLNCLKRAHINKVGEALEMTRPELYKIRNFGEKSLEELEDRLRKMGLLWEDSPLAKSIAPSQPSDTDIPAPEMAPAEHAESPATETAPPEHEETE